MADINIQRKKSSPSPWLLVLLVLLGLAAVGYYAFRADSDQPTTAPAVPSLEPAADSTTGAETAPRPTNDPAVAEMATEEPGGSPEELAAFAASDATTPTYGRRGLEMLMATLRTLADRDDLRDATVSEKRDDLTSATSRLQEQGTSLRPGYVAAANLIKAMQQKGYPALETKANELVGRANELTGRTTSPQEQQQVQEFLRRAADIVGEISQPAR
ncbi:hypothetical protein HMJ29_09480 [Hymenobacter taeanensis]|uniref:Uncharacterized protein n=1 Tax=Hymenobacter taeanensis TaxID=2735321 RepID=A0A6M6BH87_9BACT|nr:MULTISPECIES: hypothetical protein [Hymenobacter]QJX47154.1 hypothetical protein HMJ29_09480 [Hymenobacter taeanensis]UOQ81072.1 hypothetical protein MUN83_20045 [Hymenobacter sp. 5414T-23]